MTLFNIQSQKTNMKSRLKNLRLTILISLITLPILNAQTPFTDVTVEAGLVDPTDPSLPLSHIATEIITGMNIGTGAAWIDYDSDGFLDLYITNREAANWMFHNNGDGTFTDQAATLGLQDASGDGSGIAFADYNNDGLNDLYLCNGFGDRLFKNLGSTFEDVTTTAGFDVDSEQRSTSASWGDYNNDGFLDLYISRHFPIYTASDDATSQDQLYHNNGDGTFTDVSSHFTTSDLLGAGFIAGWTDFDKDGDMDILLINDCPLGDSPEQVNLFRNDGGTDGITDWTFTEIAVAAGIDDCKNGMGIGIGDYNRDGWMDFYYSNIGPATFYKNNGDNTFSDVTDIAGVGDQGMFKYSWAACFLDHNNNGWQDLFLVSGNLKNDADPNYLSPNYFYENNGDETFSDISGTINMGDETRGRNGIFGDYDNDGDLDALILNYNEPMHLRKNNNDNGNHWIQISLNGTDSNKNGIGSKIKVTTPDDVVQYFETRSGSGLGGGDALYAHFGLATNSTITEIEITWPSGTIQTETNIGVDNHITLTEPEAPLPVELSQFSVKEIDHKAVLSWTTTSETNNDYFIIQKSNDSRNFQNIGRVNGNMNSDQIHEYQFVDDQPFDGNNYYRLKQVDFNGASEFSQIAFLNFERKDFLLSIAPNPVVGNSFDVQIKNGLDTQLVFYDLFGQVIWTQANIESSINISTKGLSNGIYFLSVYNNGERSSFKVVIAK